LTKNSEDKKQPYARTRSIYDACPHCGHELSHWQQVLLSIDRALVCKNCWYRIILEISEEDKTHPPPKDKE
jgi:DNA-directed RNA polymerase subunit RPC12/RpoP